MIKTITQENYQTEVLQASEPVLVELWAAWCPYCQRLSPILDQLAAELGDTVTIGKVNIDQQPELAEMLDDAVIPTLYVFKNGNHGDKLIAPGSLNQVKDFLKNSNAI